MRRLRYFIYIWVLTGLLGASVLAQQTDEQYLSALPDVPLAPGLQELVDTSWVFDKPEGRIVRLMAMTQNGDTLPAIADFYAVTLPNLGWHLTTHQPLSFAREGEILRISVRKNLVIFDLTPNNVQ
ncbi:MAG: hypothetical protein ACR2OT_05155 [Parvibaculales bacterium]